MDRAARVTGRGSPATLGARQGSINGPPTEQNTGHIVMQAFTARRVAHPILSATILTVILAGCQGLPLPGRGGAEATRTAPAIGGGQLAAQDVEAPEIFSAEDSALWDGRPSLGGVWVAATDVRGPERIVIRNPANGRSVNGALFKKEHAGAGPPLQLSSDAATALGILAGAPTEIAVVALREREASEAPAAAAAPPLGPAAAGLAAPDLDTAPAPDPVAEIEASASQPTLEARVAAAVAATRTAEAKVATRVAAAPSTLDKAYVQIGTFSDERNARDAADRFRAAGIAPDISPAGGDGPAAWRVILGPAVGTSERTAFIDKARELGFADAYPVGG